MKFLVAVVALLAVVHSGTCSWPSQTEYIQYMKQRSQMEKLVDQFDGLCPGKRNDFEEAVEKLKECTDEIDENNETMCSAVKNHFLRCSKPIISMLEGCIPEESKGITELAFRSVSNAVSYICKTDGEHIFELANSCVLKTSFRSRMCERRVRTKLQQYKRKSPSKTEICELMVSMKPCLVNHLQDACGNKITRESFLGIYDAMTSVCSTVEMRDEDEQINYNHINEVEVFEE